MAFARAEEPELFNAELDQSSHPSPDHAHSFAPQDRRHAGYLSGPMPAENVEIVRAYLRAMAAGALGATAELWDPDIAGERSRAHRTTWGRWSASQRWSGTSKDWVDMFDDNHECPRGVDGRRRRPRQK